MRILRKWCMPNSNTFEMQPVKDLLDQEIDCDDIVVDPFARNSMYAKEWSNDLNPQTDAKFHMDAVAFCDMLIEQNVQADVVLFDPPYSPRQITECYQSIGKEVTAKDTQNARLYKEVKSRLARILKPGGTAICFGWNSNGFGKTYGFRMRSIMLLPHGSAHYDTIVTVEEKPRTIF